MEEEFLQLEFAANWAEKVASATEIDRALRLAAKEIPPAGQLALFSAENTRLLLEQAVVSLIISPPELGTV